jgi:hypothetical protein
VQSQVRIERDEFARLAEGDPDQIGHAKPHRAQPHDRAFGERVAEGVELRLRGRLRRQQSRNE